MTFQVLTERGTLAGLHNGDGHVVWSRSYGLGAAPTHLLPWRSSHDVQHAPEARFTSAIGSIVIAIKRHADAAKRGRRW